MTAWQRGPSRAAGDCPGRHSRAADPPTPARGLLPTAPGTLPTPQPGLRLRSQSQLPPEATRTQGSQGQTTARQPQPRTPGAGPSAGHALSRAEAPVQRHGQSQPSIRGLVQYATLSCKKSPPLAPSWPIGGWLPFGRPSSLASMLAATVLSFWPSGVGRRRVGPKRCELVGAEGRSSPACRPHPESCLHSFILRWASGRVPSARLPGGGPTVLTVRLFTFAFKHPACNRGSNSCHPS